MLFVRFGNLRDKDFAADQDKKDKNIGDNTCTTVVN